MPEPPALSVVVFAFDEGDNVGPVLDELRGFLERHEPHCEVIFVDDGSHDTTAERAEAALQGMPHKIVRHTENRGIGAALRSGVRCAHAPWVTFMPADGQIEPDAIKTLRDAAAHDEVDAVFSLYEDRDDGLHRRLLSAGMRTLVRAIHGVQLESDGPYLFRRDLFERWPLHSDSFFFNLEFPIRILLDGSRTRCVTIRCRPRRSGRTKSARMRVIARVARELLAFRLRRAME